MRRRLALAHFGRPQTCQWCAAWYVDERLLSFVEGLRSSDSSNLRDAGFRPWAIPDGLGLNVVTACSASGSLNFSVGIGWHGIRLP